MNQILLWYVICHTWKWLYTLCLSVSKNACMFICFLKTDHGLKGYSVKTGHGQISSTVMKTNHSFFQNTSTGVIFITESSIAFYVIDVKCSSAVSMPVH